MVFSLKNVLAGNLAGAFAGRGAGARFKTEQGFSRTLNKGTLWAQSGADITCTAAVWTRVGVHTIPAQQFIRAGYGRTGVEGANFEEIGHIQLHAHDDTATNSAEEAGQFRVGHTNANETLTRIYLEERSENLGSGVATTTVARNLQLPFPEQVQVPEVLSAEDSKVIVDFKGDATDIVVETAIGTAAGADIWGVPITVYQ